MIVFYFNVVLNEKEMFLPNRIVIPLFKNANASANLLKKGSLSIKMKSFTDSVLLRARWDIINEIKKELEQHGHSFSRGPMCFSVGNLEFISVALPVAGAVAGALATIIVACVSRGKKIRVVFEGDKVKEIDASNYKQEEIIEMIKEVKRIDICD